MYQNGQLDEVQSSQNLNSQHMLSRSQSRLQSSIQRIDSHIKSTLPFLQGKNDKKYIFMKIHNFFEDNRFQSVRQLRQLLIAAFEDNIEIKYFKQTKQLLKDNYNDNQLHYIIVPKIHLDWASTFAKQEREENNNKVKIYVYGILRKKEYQEKIKARSKKKIDTIPDYIDYFFEQQPDYPQKIVSLVQLHLNIRLRQEGKHVKTWALTNKYSGKKVKKRTLHFFYEQKMEAEFTGIYKSFKKKSKASWLQIYSYKTFEDVLKKIREREVVQIKEVDIARRATSKILLSQSNIEPTSIKSGIMMEGMSSQLNSSVLGASIRAINKLDQNDLNIIIIHGYHSQRQKFKSLVRAQKNNNWFLWQIDEGSSDVMTRLRDFLNAQAKNNQTLQNEQYQRILHCKHLIIMAHVNDDTTTLMFQNQKNTLNHMQIIHYQDPEQFSILLREGVESLQNFTIAVVPGGFRSFATDYERVIKEFNAAYKNGDSVQNFKFVSSAMGRHGSNIFMSSNLLGTQSNLTEVKMKYDQDLQKIMKQRDRLFHPFQGLTGFYVHLLIQQSITHELDSLMPYIDQNRRITFSSYIDKQMLKIAITNKTIKDSVIIITNDYTLREAQYVLQQFQKVYILNITDRQKPKPQKKVVASGPKSHIYELIKTIPTQVVNFQQEFYDQTTNDQNYVRKNRYLPKDLDLRLGSIVTVRIPSSLKDDQSQKIETRLLKQFFGLIQIEYYNNPRQIRLLNKSEQMLSFIIWAYNTYQSKQRKQQLMSELQYLKQLAYHQDQQLRQEFIVYSDVPQQFKYLVEDERHTRFKFVSSRWERIQEYIVGHFKKKDHDTIPSDMTMIVFHDDNDQASNYMIQFVKNRRNLQKFNAANHIQFRIIEDIKKSLEEESPLFKFYIVINQNSKKISLEQLQKLLSLYQDYYIRVILIKDDFKKIEKTGNFIRKTVGNYQEAGDWLCKTVVENVNYYYMVPHVLIDKHTLNYYYFLDKFSSITGKFTYQFFTDKQQLKRMVKQKRQVSRSLIWIIACQIRTLTQYSKALQKFENFKNGNVKFIYEGNESIAQNMKSRIIFKNQSKKQIQKFLLNIYRRDKRVYFPLSVGTVGNVALLLLNNSNGTPLAINEQEITRWRNILKARVERPKNMAQLSWMIQGMPDFIIYIVVPFSSRQQIANLFDSKPNVKRIFYAPFKEYNFRELDDKKIVQPKTQIFRGTYPAQITEYLKILRFNIRKPQAYLEKTIKNQLIELYFQEQYKLNNFQVLALTRANDSLIINKNGFKTSNIIQLLKATNNFDYLHIFVGDESSGKQIMQYNKKYNRDIRFIDMKTPQLGIMRGESKNKNWMLQTNDQKELITYLFNLPENRYQKALNHKGKFNIYVANDKASANEQYVKQLKNAENRNKNIVIHVVKDFVQTFGNQKQPSFGLIPAENQRIALQNVGKKQVYYIIVNDEQRPDKSYSSSGNKYFITRKKSQFKYFVNQLPTQNDNQIQAIQLPTNDAKNILNNIKNLISLPLPISTVSLTFYPNFIPIAAQQTEFVHVQLIPGTIDSMPPTLSNINITKVDVPPQLLGLDILIRIKDTLHDQVQARIIPLILDFPPSKEFRDIKNMPDRFNNILLPLAQIPKPPVKILQQKLAVLHPSTYQFTQIGQALKKSLEPQQFTVTLISFKTQLDLEQYSKNNGQRLNGYDKIVVFLSNIYRKYDPILKTMKSKLGGRMQYFIFDDNFHLQNHSKLKVHLKPYKIKKYELPFKSQNLPKFINHCAKILILTPYHQLKKYESLKATNINVIGYNSEQQTHKYLHSENTFIILVVTRQNYHIYKLHSKISPCCILLVDTENHLPEDELYLYRIWIYTIYYGRNGEQYLKKILPTKPIPPFHQKNRNLFYSVGQEELVFVNQYDQYEKIFFKDWNQLYNYIVIIFKGRSNWLIKNSIGKPEVVPLHPVVYLESKQYMKDFKNSYGDRGYLNEQNIMRKSKLAYHQFADLHQVYYNDQKDLIRHLQKQEAPSVVLFNLSNLGRMSFLRAKHIRHKWIGLTDNSQRWIDPEGILMDVNDYRLKRKQDIFANMFNKDVFDAFNDMRYFYLSNKANLDKKRNIHFRTKQELLQVFQNQLNLLMVVFVQAKDVNHVPSLIINQANDPNGRAKLIRLDIDFIDHQDDLYVKFNEIDPVIKHINDVEQAGRIDFMVYHQGEGQRTVQTLIQKRRLSGLDDRVYTNMQQVQAIAFEIKGKYKKVYVVCFQDERQQIQNILNKYSIKNKGIEGEGVQFHYIDRKSFIIPNPSRIQIQPYVSQLLVNTNISANNNIDTSKQKKVEVNITVRKKMDIEPIHQNIISHRQIITITQNEPSYIEEQSEQNQIYGLPNMDSNIKPDRKLEKMQNILSNKNFDLKIDDQLKNLFPVGKFFTNRATFFNHHDNIPTNQGSQVIIATEINNQLLNLSKNPNKLVIVVGNDNNDRRATQDIVIMGQDQIPGLIRRLEGSNVEDQLTNQRNIDDYNKVRVVYDKDIDFESKRRLLAASDKHNKIYPIVYKNVNQLKTFLQQPDSLLLLMMKQVPAGLEDAVQREHKTIVKKKKVKMILPKKSDSDINGLQTILEQEEVEQQGQNLNYLSDQQVDVYLKLFETYLDQRPKITKPDDWQGERYQDRYQGQGGDMDNITRLNVHSNIDPQNLLQQNEISKIKQRLNGDFIVLVVDNTKRGQVDEAIKKFNVLVQGYTNSMNLQNDIRDRKDNVTIAVIDRNMLDKIPSIKKKYPHTAFILQSDNPHDQGIQVYRPYLSGQIKKIADLDKIIAELYQQNERIRFNAQSNRAASRFQMKRTSIVDLSNNERFTVGLSNQKSKKAFLFFKEPQNNHVRVKLSQLFTNISCIPYKSVNDFKRLIDTYNNYTSILIANGNDIPELEEFVSRKKELIYVIRYNPPPQLRDNPKVKKLFSTYNKDDLQRFIMDEFQKISMILPYDDIGQKYKSTKNAQGKRYIQKYEPNTFGTTPRFARDFVPPKSKQSTYSRRYMKSASNKSRLSRLETLSPQVQRNDGYYAG